MKRKFRVISCLVCLILSCSLVMGCTPETPEAEIELGQKAGFELPHTSGVAETDSQYYYNADLFYRNETYFNGADPACIYISLEDITDTYNRHKQTYMYKENGEWNWIDDMSEEQFVAENGTLQDWIDKYCNNYYMATTGNTRSITSATKAKYGNDVVSGAYGMKMSQDLVNWERCGTIDGYAIAIRNDDYAEDYFWAPEFIRDQKTGYYFMVFSCSSKAGNANTVYPMHTGDSNDFLNGAVAMSANPQGPYELITAEDYISIRAAKNKDGSIKTGTELITNKFSGVKYYEVFDYEGNLLGYKNGSTFYNLNGYEVTNQTPVFSPGYYYPRYVEDSEEKTAKLAEMEKACEKSIKADGKPAYVFGGIDYFPAVDDDGNLYVFFTAVGVGGGFYGIWVVEMFDYISPNWATLRMVMKPNINKVVDNGTFLGDWDGVTEVYEGTVNEATEILYHEGRWYIAYSYFGYTDVRYSVGVAVADNPLGPYDKFNGAYNPVLGKGVESNNYKGGTGHHVFVKAGDELFMLYHATHNPDDNYDNSGNYLGRHIGVDRAVWKYVPELGYDMLFGNGATVNLQPKPETVTGYTNVAKTATITGNGDIGEVEYLNDGLVTAQPFARRFEYGKTDGDLEVTLKWDDPVEIKAFMIYNAGSYYHAFNKVNTIRLKLAEKPAWYKPTEYNGYCYIENLLVDPDDQVSQLQVVRHGSAAIAEFNPIKITEMTIYVSGNAEDKYEDTDEEGYYDEGYKEVRISDIYIFGNKA